MIQKLAAALLVGACLTIAACNTVRGAAADVGSAANCTENTMHGGKCCASALARDCDKKNPAGSLRRGFVLGQVLDLVLEVVSSVGIEAMTARDDVSERIVTGA